MVLARYDDQLLAQTEAEGAGLPVVVEGDAGVPGGVIVAEVVPPEAERAAVGVAER